MIEIDVTRKLVGSNGEFNLVFKTTIASGELITIYGPSGAGKTSVLRMMAGLMNADHGSIKAFSELWFDSSSRVNLPPQQRRIGMVFQDYSLFPNMTVRGNLEFALKKGEPASLVDEMLKLTELSALQDKRPSILSGGQKQRVAVARALIRKPKVLLLDEPLSALDFGMQSKLQDYLLNIHGQFNLITILVSHDIKEVMKMSSRVLVLDDGHIVKEGNPRDVLS